MGLSALGAEIYSETHKQVWKYSRTNPESYMKSDDITRVTPQDKILHEP